MQLREAVSLYSRVHPLDQNYLDCLKNNGQLYFNSVSLFLGSPVSPTVWTIGYAIPYHAQLSFTMQGREANYTMIAAFARHGTLILRWQLVFRHEYISCVWLTKYINESTVQGESVEDLRTLMGTSY